MMHSFARWLAVGVTKIPLPVPPTAHRGKKKLKDFKVLSLLHLLLFEEDFAAHGLCLFNFLAVDSVEVVGAPFLIEPILAPLPVKNCGFAIAICCL